MALCNLPLGAEK